MSQSKTFMNHNLSNIKIPVEKKCRSLDMNAFYCFLFREHNKPNLYDDNKWWQWDRRNEILKKKCLKGHCLLEGTSARHLRSGNFGINVCVKSSFMAQINTNTNLPWVSTGLLTVHESCTCEFLWKFLKLFNLQMLMLSTVDSD